MAAFASVVSLVIFSLSITFTHQLSLRLDQEPPPTEQSSYIDPPDPDPECPPKETWSWFRAHCEKNCTNYDKMIPCPRISVPGCVCEKGFVRGPDKKCITSTSCPSRSEEEPSRTHWAEWGPDDDPECPQNEEWSWCLAHCQKNCTNFDKLIPCPKLCVPGCICRKGFVRGPNDKCIQQSSCTQQSEEVSTQTWKTDRDCPEHEHSDWCYAHCQKNCTNYDKPIACPDICVPGCVCDEGYVRGHDGSCIPKSSCPAQSVKKVYQSMKVDDDCPANEHSDWCYAHCQKDCTNYDTDLPCAQICVPGCVCDEGYVRGHDGSCVLISSCPAKSTESTDYLCPPKMEHSLCEAHCQRTCSNWNDTYLACAKTCVPGCVCQRGLVKDESGRCMDPRKCSSDVEQMGESDEDVQCPTNEVYSECDAYPNCQKNCGNYNKRIICPLICFPGCVCEEGYVRGEDGKCIQISKCPASNDLSSIQDESRKCTANEDFSSCGAHPACQRHCSDSDKPVVCSQVCYPGCICKDGYVRGADGSCVESSECLQEMESIMKTSKTCTENEEFSTSEAHPACQRRCSDLDKTMICPGVSYSGCICKEGYVRGEDGTCMEMSKCLRMRMEAIGDLLPIPNICRRDEVFSVCVSSCPDDCDNYKDTSRKCNLICLPGCTCKSGTVRGPDGKCIRPDLCPSDKKPEDCTDLEFYDTCGTDCPDTCTNYAKDDRPCDKRCVIGCFCLPGYVRGPNGDCIFPFECPTGSSSQVYMSSSERTSSTQDFTDFTTSPDSDVTTTEIYTSSPGTEQAQANFRAGCPDEEACTAECQKLGRRYGICAGARNRDCVCF